MIKVYKIGEYICGECRYPLESKMVADVLKYDIPNFPADAEEKISVTCFNLDCKNYAIWIKVKLEEEFLEELNVK